MQGDVAGSYARMKAKVSEELKQHFRPEFLNRVDEIIVFPPLSQEQIVHMVDNMIAGVELRLKDRDMSLELTQAAKNLLATSPAPMLPLGAREAMVYRSVASPWATPEEFARFLERDFATQQRWARELGAAPK